MSTASVSASETRDGNGLAALANKCAARTFDISSGMVYASMRDQIVRAQLLVRDLKKADPKCNRLLIVGAGLAGASAAVHASALGIETVVLETKSDAFELQFQVSTRMVGPFMYEWPNIEYQLQHYPEVEPGLGAPSPETPNWESEYPMSAKDLATSLRKWLEKERRKPSAPHFLFNVKADWARDYVRDFVESAKSSDSFAPPTLKVPPFVASNKGEAIDVDQNFSPDYVILAVGMGEERVHLIDEKPKGMRGLPFWHDDDLCSSCVENMDVAVFGAGDGALQDVLRILTTHEHPLNFIKALENGENSICADINRVRPVLSSLEHQSRLFATWSSGQVYDLIDAKCEQLCIDLSKNSNVRMKVFSQLRNGRGRVHHIYRESHLTRAYLLNRFCVHLIKACQTAENCDTKMRYIQYKETTVISAEPKSNPAVAGEGGSIELNNGNTINPNKLVVRFGPDKPWIENFQIVRLTPETHPDRVSMATIPLPYVVSI